jgi:hypothetical protein
MARSTVAARRLAAVARRIIHGIVERALLRRLRQVQKVGKEDHVAGSRHAALEHASRRRAALRFRCTGAELEHTCDQGPDRVASLFHAEIEHERDMTGESARARFLRKCLR